MIAAVDCVALPVRGALRSASHFRAARLRARGPWLPARGFAHPRIWHGRPAPRMSAHGGNADAIRTDHERTPGALGWKVRDGKKDPGQKKEGDKGYQRKNKRTRLLAGPVRKIPFEIVPMPAPPRRFWRAATKLKMRHEKLSARPRFAKLSMKPGAFARKSTALV